MLLESRIALVTEGGQGDSTVTTRGIAREGAHVVDIDPSRAQRIAEEIRHGGRTTCWLPLDVTDERWSAP